MVELAQVLDFENETSYSEKEEMIDSEFQYQQPAKKHKKEEFLTIVVSANPLVGKMGSVLK